MPEDVVATTEAAAVETQTVNDTAKTGEARFTQADIDRIVKERLERAEKKVGEAAAKAKADAEAAGLAEQGKFKELHEKTLARVNELEPMATQLEEANATLKTLLDAEMANPAMPASTKELLADMSPTKALAHITKHKGEWAKPTAPNLNGAGGGKGGTEKDIKEREAELAQRFHIKAR